MARKTLYETLRGKVNWCRIDRPNKFGKWSLDLYPDSESMVKLNKLKETPAIKNVIKQDDDGKYITIHRDTQKLMGGKMVMFKPPIVLQRDPNGGDPIPMKSGVLIGNGSDCSVEIEVYGWDGNQARGIMPGRAIRIYKVLVWNLVPYETRRDMPQEEQDYVRGLLEQPPMPQW